MMDDMEYNKEIIKLIRHAMPEEIARQIVDVQPILDTPAKMNFFTIWEIYADETYAFVRGGGHD